MDIASIILCAGKSTRMKSAKSKMLHSVCGKALCVWPVEKAIALGSKSVVVVVGYQSDEVQSELTSRYPQSLQFALQNEQKGTGHAVDIGIKKLDGFKGTILVLCGDTPLLKEETLRDLCETRAKLGVNLAMLTTQVENPTGYGRILRNDQNQIRGVIEESDANETQRQIKEINPGIYAFDSEFLRDSLSRISANNSKHEYYLTDIVEIAAKSGSVTGIEMPAFEALGINDRVQLASAEKALRQQIIARWMKLGVSCVDPENVLIDADVQLGEDVLLENGVQLLGSCVIDRNVTIGTGSILTHTHVGEGARVHPYSICERASIGPRAQIGPFARLRPESHLEEEVKIGNFVEVKKSHFKKGSKANHLAYIGDAEIGARSNIGAGTITCNYDGSRKHKSVLGDNVFIGSNTTLVAPLTIGQEAYVAAGSTLTKDVPQDALAIGRSRQENKEGYAVRIRRKLER